MSSERFYVIFYLYNYIKVETAMRFSKHQIKVLAVLHLVVAVMLLGVILMPKGGGGDQSTPVQGEPEPPDGEQEQKPHDKFRDPRIAFDEDIFWETNIGGTGNEQVENAYEIGDKLYIIGNTDSKDLDFDGADGGIFLTVMSQNGKPLAYCFYGGRLIKSSLVKSGIFCLSENGGKYSVFVIDTNGAVKSEKELPLGTNEKPIDFVCEPETDGIHIIIEATAEFPPQKRLQALSLKNTLEPTEGVALSNSFPLEYVAALPRENGYIIVANAYGAKTGELVIYEWNTSNDKLYSQHDYAILNRKFKAVDFMPYSDGYAALIIDETGVADVYTIGYGLKDTAIVLLGEENIQSGRLFSDNVNNYIYLRRQNGTTAAYKTTTDMKNKSPLGAIENLTEISAFRTTKTDTYFGGKNAFSPVVTILNHQGVSFEKAFGATTETIKAMLPSKGSIFVICESSGTSQNVGKNFGGTDALIVKLRFV